ncbi:MAG: EamA family transporter [Planctomycetia bacterium]
MTVSIAAGTTWLGIAAGLFSGACMSLSYLLSRHHALGHAAEARQGAALGLLLRSHIVMGLVSAPVAALFWPAATPSPASFGLPLVAASLLYLLGNLVLFSLLRRTEASRLTPFLGLKIFMLAIVVAVVVGEPLSGRQWLAVALSVAATALLQGTAGGLSRGAFTRILCVCLLFALADLCIVRLIDALETGPGGSASRLSAAMLAMLLTYVVCGATCVALLVAGWPAVDRGTGWAAWRAACIYAATWLAAMAGLYVCFGLVGALFGNVVQSTRGIMSVVIGALLAHLGWHELEQRVDRATLVRRIGAAALITAAIAVYVM